MSLSSSSGPDNANMRNIMSQVLASTPQAVPTPDKLAGNETKQIQQTRQGKNTEMQSDTAIAGTQGKNKTDAVLEAEDSSNIMAQQGIAAGKETATANAANAANSAEIAKAINLQTSIEETNKTLETTLSSLSSVDSAQVQEIQELVASAVSGQSARVSDNFETPDLPKPSITPRQDVMEISMALAKAIASLGEATASALSNYQSTQAQAESMNRASLESQGLKIDSERAEFKKMKELEAKSASNQTLNTVSTVMIAVSVAITVISVVSALFTCGLGLIGTAAAGATAAGAAGAAAATAGVTAGAAAATATATSVATTVATQVTMQAVIQTIKTAIVEAVKQAITAAIKEAAKLGIKQVIKQVIQAAVKTLMKNMSKIFNTGKELIAKSFPRLAKVMENLGSKWVAMGLGTAIAVPSLVKGIGDINISHAQQELATIQRETGMLTAQSEMMKMFTLFWQQASKIAAKQTDGASEMQQQATKLGAQISKAFTAISAGLASAV
ncbi:secretion system effector C (SseC) like family protein [Chlamydia ibidis]|uniref:Secretion system effector C (SseC) like family protein n=2 Tax=Chlamydia ibidis TaxID=1405396 RepID=S7KF08_9CHLA|nr:secretion system effector C (SseC) like family protein [Chlamydia ibidis]EPP34736.1 secretion system effector C (SseC) like family protein [Chlamydia ibidis]EQM62293.1 secretion system effector C (SseC) like family protein [Chlamydia ibidis 10-1398/6]